MVFAQIVGSTSTLIDREQGNFGSRSVFPEYFDLASLQNILGAADRLAQQHHIGHIYAATGYATNRMVRYLAQFEQTPIVTFDQTQCVVLLALETGPVVFIAPPDATLLPTILSHYAHAAVAETVPHPGGAPYSLYIVTANAEPTATWQLSGGWQGLSTQAQVLTNAATGEQWLTTRWRIPNTQAPQPRTIYNYQPHSQLDGAESLVKCAMTATNAGDQLFMLQSVETKTVLPKSVSLQLHSFIGTLQDYLKGVVPFKTVTFDMVNSPDLWIQPLGAQKQIVMDISLAEP